MVQKFREYSVHRSRMCVCLFMRTMSKDDLIKRMAVALVQNLYRQFLYNAENTKALFKTGDTTLLFNLSRSHPRFLYIL